MSKKIRAQWGTLSIAVSYLFNKKSIVNLRMLVVMNSCRQSNKQRSQ